MKRILIAGANSYIGTSLASYLELFDGEYFVQTLDLLSPEWRNADFANYDAVVHIAGIAHQRETKGNADSYYKVNCDLTVEVAQKAKEQGVGQFVFLSTMSVYGRDVGVITPQTPPAPRSHYGKSKLMAEEKLNELQDEHFIVSVLRPPMVYGKNCKGNFQALLKIIKMLPIFPCINNRRSMIYIEHLSAFIKLILDHKEKGVFFPQNKEYVNTFDVAKIVSDTISKPFIKSRLFGFGVFLFRPCVPKLRKAFGSLQYVDTEKHDFAYCKYDFVETIMKSI